MSAIAVILITVDIHTVIAILQAPVGTKGWSITYGGRRGCQEHQ